MTTTNKEYKIKFPFLTTQYYADCEDGGSLVESWKPGTKLGEMVYDGHEPLSIAEGEGFMVLTFIGTFKPGKYPERTFYIRKWIDPAGKTFGSNALKMTTTQNFKKMIEKGYRYPYEVEN